MTSIFIFSRLGKYKEFQAIITPFSSFLKGID